MRIAGDFYRVGAEAARSPPRRAVLLVGDDAREAPEPAPDRFVVAYAPYDALFPHAAAIVHQGGIGTTAQALRAGRPMLVVPWSHDQPDNAERVRRLSVTRVVERWR